MKQRIIEFLKNENKSSAQFAEEIGVQPSGISHILSGRNNPSLDFVLKMLDKYQFLSSDWLLFGRGTMYKDQAGKTLFDLENFVNKDIKKPITIEEPIKSDREFKDVSRSAQSGDIVVESENKLLKLKRIVWFFDDNSFEEYFPK